MSETWPWAALVGLGMYHGLNPAMGWLFAVALGLHRRSRAVVVRSLAPIALGHALAIAIVAGLVAAAGLAIEPATIRAVAGSALVLWALYQLLYGARHRVRIGMQAGFAGLVLWSFLMSTAHGAGIMLVPALIPLCPSGSATGAIGASGSLAVSLLAVSVHTAAMLAVSGVIAGLVYEWVGLAFLRHGWINFNLLWTAALLATGCILLAA